MTVSSETRRVQYNGSGTTGPFSVPFYFLDEGDLQVIQTDTSGVDTVLTITTEYTVSGEGDQSGGSVTTVSAVASGEKLTIIRSVAYTQGTDYQENDSFPAETHEQALDKLTMLVQQTDEKVDRSLKAPTTSSIIDGELPSVTADYILRINSSADGFEAVSAVDASLAGTLTPTDGNFIVGDGTDWVTESGATARTSLGLGSISTQAASSVSITGGSITGITDLAVADGGTGASTASAARTNLGLEIGTDVQAYSASILENVVEDTTPQLGGDLDVNTNSIVSTSNGDINITPNGTGNVTLGNFTFDADATVGAGQDDYVLTYDHSAGTIGLEASAGGGGGLSDVVDDTTPQLGGQLDVNGNAIGDGTRELLTFTEDASAVNHVEIENEATGSGPILRSAGDDAAVDLNIDTKSTGSLLLNTGGSNRADITASGLRLGGANARVTTILDEDAMGSDSATSLATQQSIKAYVDSQVGGGSTVLLGSATASSSASLDFTTEITSTYDIYMIVGSHLNVATDDVGMNLLVSTNGGSSYLTTNYAGATIVRNESGSTNTTTWTAAFEIVGDIAGNRQGNDATHYCNFVAYLYNPNAAAATYLHADAVINSTGTSEPHRHQAYGFQTGTTAVDAIRIVASSGNLDSGTVYVYGLKKA